MESQQREIDQLRGQIAALQNQLAALTEALDAKSDAKPDAATSSTHSGEESLGDSEALLSAIPDMLFRVKQDGAYLSFRAPDSYQPYRPIESVIGTNVRDSVPAEVADAALIRIEKAITSRQVQSMEAALPTDDGEVYRDVRIVPAGDDEALIMIRDITAEKRIRQAYDLSQRENKLLMSAIPDLLLRIRSDGTFAWARAPRDFPLLAPLEDVIGRRMNDILPPPLAAQSAHHIALALKTQQNETFQYTLSFDQRELHWEARVIPATDDEVLVMIRDVTEHRLAEIKRDEYICLADAIRRIQSIFISQQSSSQTYEDILDELLRLTDSEYGFIGETLVDDNGAPYLRTLAITNIAWNERTQKLYAQSSEQGLEFKNLETLFGQVMATEEVVIANDPATDARRGGLPDGHPPLNSFLGIPLRHEGQVIGIAGVANRPNGYTSELVEYLEPFLTSCSSLLAAYRDHLRRLEAERRLEQQQAQLAHVTRLTTLGEMVAVVAHELTQPLSAISNYAAAAKAQLSNGNSSASGDSPAESADWIDKIAEQSKRGGKIIRQLRGYVQRSEPKMLPVDLAEVVQDALGMMDAHLRQHHAQLTFSVFGESYPVIADAVQVQQVIVNLVSNACESISDVSDNRKQIDVRLTYDSTNAIISVTDDGGGMRDGVIQRIFEPFYTTKPEGLGMGLAVCKSIVEFHGGQIWMSTHPTTFQLQFPRELN